MRTFQIFIVVSFETLTVSRFDHPRRCLRRRRLHRQLHLQTVGQTITVTLTDKADKLSRINEFGATPERPFVLGLPTGSSPIPTYKALIQMVKAGKLSYVAVRISPTE